MKRFAFISRHGPTQEQAALAAKADIELVHVGDRDGFTVDPSEFLQYAGVVVVHAGAALTFAGNWTTVGVFKNETRPAVGEKPQFLATELHLYAPKTRVPWGGSEEDSVWDGIGHTIYK